MSPFCSKLGSSVLELVNRVWDGASGGMDAVELEEKNVGGCGTCAHLLYPGE